MIAVLRDWFVSGYIDKNQGGDIVRILYFFDKGRIILATNGFVKKKQKTPRSEIELAKRRRLDYRQRKEAGTYE